MHKLFIQGQNTSQYLMGEFHLASNKTTSIHLSVFTNLTVDESMQNELHFICGPRNIKRFTSVSFFHDTLNDSAEVNTVLQNSITLQRQLFGLNTESTPQIR